MFTKFTKKQEYIILFFLIVVAVFFRLQHIATTPVYEDEVLAISVARSIVGTGIPYTPAGYVYSRSPLTHYSLAGMISLFGDNIAFVRLFSFVFGILSLVFTYVLGRGLFGGSAALWSVAFLVISQFENTFSYSARMYIAFQSMTLFSILFFYRGFFEKRKMYIWLFVLFYTLTILTHQGGIVLLPVLYGYLFFQFGLRKWMRLALPSFVFVSGFTALIMSVMYFVPGRIHAFTVNHLPLGLFVDTGFHLYLFEIFMPLSSFAVLIALVAIFRRGLRARPELYAAFVFVAVLLFLSVFTSARFQYVVFIFPLYVLLVFYGVRESILFIRLQLSMRRRLLFGILLVLALMTHFVVSIVPASARVYSFQSYHYDFGPYYAKLSSFAREGDIVLCTDTLPALWYFRCDYFVRQNLTSTGWKEFEDGAREPYTGVLIVDSIDDVKKIVREHDRVWFAADVKFWGNVSPVMTRYLMNTMYLRHSERDGEMLIYSSF